MAHRSRTIADLLDRKDIDAVIVATGEFQRVRPLHSCLPGGKDVYAEKPLTLYISEGRALVNAVRHYNRIFRSARSSVRWQ